MSGYAIVIYDPDTLVITMKALLDKSSQLDDPAFQAPKKKRRLLCDRDLIQGNFALPKTWDYVLKMIPGLWEAQQTPTPTPTLAAVSALPINDSSSNQDISGNADIGG